MVEIVVAHVPQIGHFFRSRRGASPSSCGIPSRKYPESPPSDDVQTHVVPSIEPRAEELQPATDPTQQQIPALSTSQRLWNIAYNKLEEDEDTAELVRSYVEPLTKVLTVNTPKTVASGAGDISAELKDPAKRQKYMEDLVKEGQSKVATASKITKGVGDVAQFVLSAKEMIDAAIQNKAVMPEPSVCSRCDSLDLDKIFKLPSRPPGMTGEIHLLQDWTFKYFKSWVGGPKRVKICDVSYDDLISGAQNGCVLCRLLSDRVERGNKFVLSAFVGGNSGWGYGPLPLPQFTVLGLETEDGAASQVVHLACKDPEKERCTICPIIKNVTPSRANMELAKKWIQRCMDSHEKCSHQAETSGYLEGITLIDCENVSLVTVSETLDYCALSYAWGSLFQESRPRHLNPDSLLPVIKDAVSVTLQLGYRYLWVDQFCIPQDNEAEKLRQIAQMDIIYAKASVTIVVASGDGAHCGIPGIGDVSRLPNQIIVKGHKLVSPPKETIDLVRKSLWSSRGWTFQEDRLSTRVIYFTSDQMIFRCSGAGRSERFSQPYTESCGMEPARMKYDYFQSGFEQKGDDLETMVSNYSTKAFTFQNDISFAFLGISRRLEIQFNFFHLFGCLFQNEATADTIASSLAWKHTGYGQNFDKTFRRNDFPSWSWMAWGGQAGIDLCLSQFEAMDLQFSFETIGSKSKIPMKEFSQRIKNRLALNLKADMANRSNPMEYQLDLTPRIYIKGWVVPFEILESGKAWPRIRSRDNLDNIQCAYYPAAKPRKGTYKAIWLGVQYKDHVKLLVLGEDNNRIGLASPIYSYFNERHWNLDIEYCLLWIRKHSVYEELLIS